MSSRDERDALEQFAERYRAPVIDVAGAIEQRVIGAQWGANGYTTVAQADELGRRLRLGAGDALLDVGTGRGWPGLYLASRARCRVVGTDMPVDGLAIARRRAHDEGIDGQVALVAAAGAAQPFRDESFDAVVLTDVLC